MIFIPWRVKNFFSDHVPLLYHLVANLGTKGNSLEHWNERLAATWDDPGRYWPTVYEVVAARTNSSATILEVGVGNGGLLRSLKDRGFQDLHGMDISRYAINRLRAEGFRMHFGKLPAIPLPDASYDVVVASFVLEHIIRRRRFIKEVVRVLKPGGCALIFVPDNCLSPISEPEHVIAFNDRSLRSFLDQYLNVTAIESMRDSINATPILFAEAQKRAI